MEFGKLGWKAYRVACQQPHVAYKRKCAGAKVGHQQGFVVLSKTQDFERLAGQTSRVPRQGFTRNKQQLQCCVHVRGTLEAETDLGQNKGVDDQRRLLAQQV